MSTQAEKIKAQKCAFNSPTQYWHRHLIGPDELQALFMAESEMRGQAITMAILSDMVLGERADDRSEAALIRAVRELIAMTGIG